jgi:hypothetical protein
LILVNSVLTAMLANAMAVGLLPAGVIEAMDKGEEPSSGSERKLVIVETAKSPGVMSAPQRNLVD